MNENPTGRLKSLDQERAAYAWRCVHGNGALSEKARDDYVNQAKAAPALVMSNGLMQALAFLQSRKKDSNPGARRLVQDLARWLLDRGLAGSGAAPRTAAGFDALMEGLHGSASSADYMRATDEALEVLRWIRQFAAAEKAGR